MDFFQRAKTEIGCPRCWAERLDTIRWGIMMDAVLRAEREREEREAECSESGEESGDEGYRYCPNCGAKMEGVEE